MLRLFRSGLILHYPHYKGQFAQVIDSHDAYAQSLLDDFSEANKQPTIAISVDMLDTGVDVPEVVNLVFFKPVFSRVKFNQMIGRGTRLCKDLFGPDQDKSEFLVFDLCGNFDYFQQDIPENNQKQPETLTTRLVKHRLELTQLIDQQPQNTPPQEALQTSLLDALHQHVETMPRDNFIVRRRLQQVEIFSNRDRWNNLTEDDRILIAEDLASLPNGLPAEDTLAKAFDLLCLKLQLALAKTSNRYPGLRDRVRDTLSQLETKPNIPMIQAQLAFIQEVQDEHWWQDITLPMVEEIRLRIRDLVKFIDRSQQKTVITDFADELGEIQDVTVPTYQTGFIENIIDYLTQNGVMNPGMLYEAPFTDDHREGLDGIFEDDAADNIVSIIRSFNACVDVDFFNQEALG
jgi:type I restriction enzyme R subunit